MPISRGGLERGREIRTLSVDFDLEFSSVYETPHREGTSVYRHAEIRFRGVGAQRKCLWEHH